jgi:hypothetical protein
MSAQHTLPTLIAEYDATMAGCPVNNPKRGKGYWNKIRRDFPDTFERMAALQRELGPGSGFHMHKGERIRLDDLPLDAGNHADEVQPECSIMCHIAEHDFAAVAEPRNARNDGE